MNKRLQFFETEPIIAAVKTEEQLERALTSGSNIIFFLFGNICNIPKLVESVKERGKYAFVHLDLINGLAAKEIAADYIRSFTRADGRAQHQAAHTEAREGDRSHNGAAGLRAGLAGAG